MRILFGSYQAITILEGGVKTQVFALKKELEKLGIEVLLFDSWQNYKDIDVVHLFCAHLGTYHLAKSIRALNIKLIMTPVFYSKRGPNFIRSVLSLSKVLTKFGIIYPYLVTHELCAVANVVAPNTKRECELIAKGLMIDQSKIKLLPNGVDERFYYAEPSLFINKYGMKDFILYVGHIGWQRKNLLRLLKICQHLDMPMVLIGKVINNEYGKRCLEIIKSRRNTLLITDIEHSDPILSSAYAACDTLVLPSYYETPGLVALEAGLAGAKIAITKYGGTDEYFKDYVQYIEPKSNKSIKQAIEESLAQKKTNALKEHIKNNFLWSHAAEKLVEIYQTLK
ncbi:MAG: glycosyltransferase family 4 protein [candidate division WOR-3 bacterium]